MQNKIVAGSLISSVELAILAALLETDFLPLADVLYSISGVGFFVFSIWAAILLLKK